VAPAIKEAAPNAKIILFTAYHDVEPLAEDARAVDAFVLKTNAHELVPLAKRLLSEASAGTVRHSTAVQADLPRYAEPVLGLRLRRRDHRLDRRGTQSGVRGLRERRFGPGYD
jgi:hypothetical protein